MNSVYVDGVYIGKATHEQTAIAGKTHQGPVAIEGKL
ncbi:hypothetical protein M2392_004020 [Pseudomonas grimontii]|nr:hypothetical protein [Pseudomonas grimontii]